MQPVDVVHFLDEGSLSDDGADEVDGKGGGVFPVAGHHSAKGDFFF